jgi:hypothetical protein
MTPRHMALDNSSQIDVSSLLLPSDTFINGTYKLETRDLSDVSPPSTRGFPLRAPITTRRSPQALRHIALDNSPQICVRSLSLLSDTFIYSTCKLETHDLNPDDTKMTITTDSSTKGASLQEPTNQRSIHLTMVNSVKTTEVMHICETWSELASRLTSAPALVADKNRVNRRELQWPLFVPFRMKAQNEGAITNETSSGTGYSRCRANILHMDALVLDFDNDPNKGAPGFTISEAKDAFAGLAHVLYTSFNHRNPYKHNVDKFRVVLPLKQSANLEQVKERKAALQRQFPGADPASFTASQPFYIPIAHPDRVTLHESYMADGEWFDLLALEPSTKPQRATSFPVVLTGDVHTELPYITLKDGRQYRADELWASLEEGYPNRKPCFRIGSADQKAGCFVYRFGAGLSYYDPAVGKTVFIKVMRAQPQDSAAGRRLTLVRKVKSPGPAAPREVVRVTVPGKTKPQVATDSDSPHCDLLIFDETQPPSLPFEQIDLDERYLPDDLWFSIPQEGIVAIKSPKGTGKTELLKYVVADCNERKKSVMLLGHRVFLLQNLAIRTNLAYYRDLDDGQIVPSIALCMNSLTRINQKEDEPYDTVIIDESEQVFQALLSKPLERDLSMVFNNLCWLFSKARRVIVLDADLSADLTVELIQELRGVRESDHIVAVRNTYRIGSGQTTKMYVDKTHLLADVVRAVEGGDKVFVTCNSRRFATQVDAIIRALGKSTLLVTAETNDKPATQAFIKNPTKESCQYDAVIASPTLSTGVSIESNHFTKVFGFFSVIPGTYQDADQALSRVRNCTDVSVWVQGNRTIPYFPSEEYIHDSILEKERGSVKRLSDEPAPMTQGQLLWARIYARITRMVREWSVHKDRQFIALRQELGFTIAIISKDDVASKTGRDLLGTSDVQDEDRAQAIFDANDLDDEEAARLGRKRQRSRVEQLAMEKYRLREALGKKWTLGNVHKALEQELLQSLASIRRLHEIPSDVRRAEDRKDRDRNTATFTANRHSVVQHELLRSLCAAGSIDVSALYESARAGDEIEIDRKSLEAIAAAYEGRMKDFNYYFGSRIKNPTDGKSLKKVWEATIGQALSLPLVRKKRGSREQREYRYYIDTEKKDLVMQASATMQDLLRMLKAKKRG